MNDNYLSIESSLWSKGYKLIAGVDEAGRGPLAGPVVAAAVILDFDYDLSHIIDSKQMTPKQREFTYRDILLKCVAWSVFASSAKLIDRIGILPATMQAMEKAIRKLRVKPDYVIIDGNRTPKIIYPCRAIIHGDRTSRSIAAASIIAKVTRDRILLNLSKLYPQYDFDKHKGYGTVKHIDAITNYGITKHHRLSFSPLRQLAIFSPIGKL